MTGLELQQFYFCHSLGDLYRGQHGDKPLELKGNLLSYQYCQWEIADLYRMPEPVKKVYLEVLQRASILMSTYGRPLGNVWLRLQTHDEPRCFGEHVYPSYLTIPIAKGLIIPERSFWWLGKLAELLDGFSAHRHLFNPTKSCREYTLVAFVYPALTEKLKDGTTVADFLNNLG